MACVDPSVTSDLLVSVPTYNWDSRFQITAPQELTMDVRAVLVMLAVLMPLLQASDQTVNINLNIGDNTGGSGTADKSQCSSTLAELLKQGGMFQDTSQLEPQLLDMTDTCQEKGRGRKVEKSSGKRPCSDGLRVGGGATSRAR
ncbi:hypothetical protein Bbelb_319320 [Branchiostoma belcheri]|nr:hypothetical protein Bbelb_319320 [Branchiostoma belcheri]